MSEKAPGALMHFEFYVEDSPATQAFYERVFGWRFDPIPGAGYTRMMPPAAPEGGLLSPAVATLPNVLTYVRVRDRDATARDVADAGGKVLKKYDIPGVGRFCLFEAPGGIVQNAWEEPHA